ncbi:MAG: B12-binding domain-containing radical SAM protein [Desulfomonilaceae bacterium]
MKIALIIPMNNPEKGKSFYDYKFVSWFLLSKRYISYLLAIPTLASMTPPRHEVRIYDENIEDIDYSWKADLVGISVRTMFAKRAYTISEIYRKKGVKTVLGGIHPSMCPEEAQRYADAVVIGEAEEVWPTLLQDAENGALKSLYNAQRKADLTTSPVPARSFLSKNRYLIDLIQTTKGCPFHCEFCSVYAFDGQKIRNKTVEQVISEVQDINASSSKFKKHNAIFFADDNIIANKTFARELFSALIPHNINWMCQASIDISQDDELLCLMRESGCGAIFVGFESMSKQNLVSMHKGVNQRFNYLEAIKAIQSHEILVHGSFILGYDFDSESVFDELIDFIQESKLLMPLINILTPFPGTELFKRFEKERRIIHKDWSKYDARHVVFNPSTMSPEKLSEEYKKVVQRVYSFDSILERLAYYWYTDFWRHSNKIDPVKFRYRLLFALRLCTLLFSFNMDRSRFIIKVLPRVLSKNVRVSTILTLMAYNDFSCDL